ncbi:MAG TPA: hypothetical protein GXX17_02750 [Clostridiales bacterium]|nr:hypothetical protein [Clostridiales bacterium]
MTKQDLKKRWENYWYYYKVHTIVFGFVILVMAIMISQCAKKVEPDCKVVLFTHKNVPSEVVAAMEQELEKFAGDYNGDGKITVEVVDCSYNPNNPNKNIMIAQLSKLQGELGLSESILFITDIQGFKYLDEQGLFETKDLFPDLDGKGFNLKNTPFDEAVNKAVPGFFTEDYYILKRTADRANEEKIRQSEEMLIKLVNAYSQ